mmetsp:Transcript_18928/g.38370  ORF Transcript_18928/g.38370 Transcript_18928/m.38370 type:complete len:287 (+) Transcript_18928:224-1084(+)
MARGSTLAKALQVPDGIHVEVRAVPPTGDCFYDCLDLLLPPRPTSSSPLRFSPRTNGGFTRPYVRKRSLYSPRHMREYVAGTMTQELFDLYGMYSAAGVDDYAWMHHHHAPTNLDELREYARRVGRDAGAGHCLWADEYAIRTISEEAEVTLLIIDEQATSRRGNRSAFPRRRKRRRRNRRTAAAAPCSSRGSTANAAGNSPAPGRRTSGWSCSCRSRRPSSSFRGRRSNRSPPPPKDPSSSAWSRLAVPPPTEARTRRRERRGGPGGRRRRSTGTERRLWRDGGP